MRSLSIIIGLLLTACASSGAGGGAHLYTDAQICPEAGDCAADDVEGGEAESDAADGQDVAPAVCHPWCCVACAKSGRCWYDADTGCRAESDADCRASAACTKLDDACAHGSCWVDDGFCVKWADLAAPPGPYCVKDW